jgi:hypothetical protein
MKHKEVLHRRFFIEEVNSGTSARAQPNRRQMRNRPARIIGSKASSGPWRLQNQRSGKTDLVRFSDRECESTGGNLNRPQDGPALFDTAAVLEAGVVWAVDRLV